MNALTDYQKEVLEKVRDGELIKHSYKAVARALEKKGLITITVVKVRNEHNGLCFGVTRAYRGQLVAQPEPETAEGTVIVSVRNRREQWAPNCFTRDELAALVAECGLKRIKFGQPVKVGHYSAKGYTPSGCYGSGERTKFTLTNKDWMMVKLAMTNFNDVNITRG